jgi:3',5'-cyclic AMP phosphodiesterase CpdA
MRIHVLSDLHIEFGDWNPPRTDADVVVLAGDIFTECEGPAWARRQFGDKRLIYVLGNHEFYGGQWQRVLEGMRAKARDFDIELLEDGAALIDGVRFLGATLWTDFELAGTSTRDLDAAMRAARRCMNDFALIQYQERRFTPEDSRDIHFASRSWLQQELAKPFAGSTVVITHHLPHVRSIHPQFDRDALNPAFVSHLPQLVCAPVNLWIHGHTHCSFDYQVASTRVVCNPRGYAPDDLNPQFKPDFVVEV